MLLASHLCPERERERDWPHTLCDRNRHYHAESVWYVYMCEPTVSIPQRPQGFFSLGLRCMDETTRDARVLETHPG
jgi:hypothetical protein